MALLNFAKTYDEVKSYINLTESNSGDYVKLIFTKDGHIITHGHDYTKDYNSGLRGLVPNYSTELGDYGILTKSGWGTLTTNFLPMGDSLEAAIDKLWSSNKIVNYVLTYFSDAIKANDAMLFKGVLSSTETGDGVYADVPYSEYHAGWTYRVKTAGLYAGGLTCEEGDIVIAVVDATPTQTTIVPGHWLVILTNIKGKKTASINNNLIFDFYTDSVITKEIEIYAPTESGSENQVLISKGDSQAPAWIDQSLINAGLLGGVSKDNLLSAVNAANGTVSVTVGGTTKSATASGNWNINAASANKLNNAFKVTGNGLTNVTYDGSSEKEISLLPATKNSLGGVKIGDGILVDANGVISLTKDDLETILGKDIDSIASTAIVSTTASGLAPQMDEKHYGNTLSNTCRVLAYGTLDTEAVWYTLPSTAFTWRPIKINDTDLLTDSVTAVNIKGSTGTGNVGNIVVAGNGGDIIISTTAEVNQNAFSKFIVGTTEISANSKTDTITLKGTNVKIEGTAASKEIMISVAEFDGVGTKGLVNAPEGTNSLTFLRADGTWATPTDTNTWRSIIVGENTLSSDITSGALTITAGKDIQVGLSNNTLLIESTYTPLVYSANTGITTTTSGLNTVFSLKEAATNELGGIKIAGKRDSAIDTTQGLEIQNRYYGVELDSNGKAFVNVPWTDTNVRDIKINGESIGNATLNIVPSEDVILHWDRGNESDDSDQAATISFGLSWYNISTKEYETA